MKLVTVDKKGRILLGKKHAKKMFLISKENENIRLIPVVPSVTENNQLIFIPSAKKRKKDEQSNHS